MIPPSESQNTEPISVLMSADRNPMAGQLLGGSLASKSGFEDRRHRRGRGASSAGLQLRARGCRADCGESQRWSSEWFFPPSGKLRAAYPGTRTIVLLDSIEDDLVLNAFRSGARGLFCRSGLVKMLRKCPVAVIKGKSGPYGQMQLILEALESQTPPRAANPKKNNQLLETRKRSSSLRCCWTYEPPDC